MRYVPLQRLDNFSIMAYCLPSEAASGNRKPLSSRLRLRGVPERDSYRFSIGRGSYG
jgi:hypothetical protein